MNPLPLIAQEDALRIVDRAASGNDRWLFVATLMILLFFVACVIKWLVKSLETKDQAHAAERKETDMLRKTDQDAFLHSLGEVAKEVAHLTDEQKETTRVLIAHDKDMREAHRLETASLIRHELSRLGLNVELTKH